MPCGLLRLSPCTEQPHPLVGHVTGDMKRCESNETLYLILAGGLAGCDSCTYFLCKMYVNLHASGCGTTVESRYS